MPPCSVGDFVYAIRDRDKDDYYDNCNPYVITEEEVTHVGITKNNEVFVITEDGYAPEIIGRDVYLTREKCEKALAETLKAK